jgi:para-nitrobenzyl esterase
MRSTYIAVLSTLAACGGGNPNGGPVIPSGNEIPTAQGVVAGESDGTTRSFLGIPYAAPPVGALRFKPPQPPASWTGMRQAKKIGPGCAQLKTALQGGTFDTTTSEDCLTLNVWTPAPAPATPLPVMVWIHGGGFVVGTGGDSLYDGTKLSQAGPVVVVTINYRLGALGFLAHGALDGEDPSHATSGNYGLLDQRAALQWVHDNIANFGGDPKNVTIFGESAGGLSVCMQMVMPGSRGLFQRALAESGPCTVIPLADHATWVAQGERAAQALGCTRDVLTCLRSQDAKDVLSALPLKTEIVFGQGVAWTPHVDGIDVKEEPIATFRSGGETQVPFLAGANGDEGTLFVKFLGAHFADDAALRADLASSGIVASAVLDSVLARYSSKTYPTTDDAAIALIGDVFVCGTRQMVRAHAAAGNPAYLYYFTHPFKWLVSGLGAFHSAELPFVWGNAYTFISLQSNELPLSAAIQGYWTRFAAGGDPDGAGAVAWPRYAVDADPYLHLDLNIEQGAVLRQEPCAFWDGLLNGH